jgi:DUF4097 and DUF4098 domain-containing protein YvlB
MVTATTDGQKPRRQAKMKPNAKMNPTQKMNPTMKRYLRVTAFALAVMVTGPAAAWSQGRAQHAPDSDQTVTVTKGSRLLVNNFAGEVVVKTWEKDAVRVTARHSSRTKVNIRNNETSVTIGSSSSTGVASVDMEISAPAWMPVKVEGQYNFVSIEGAQSEVSVQTVRGDIVIKGGTGFVTAKSIEGEVIVEGARGRINVSSVNEGIKITGASGDINAETTNGSIWLTKVDAKVIDVTTVNGDVTYEGGLAQGGRYAISTHNGDILMTIPETGGATFVVRTYNGDFVNNLGLKGSGEGRRGRRVTYVLGNGSAEVELESFGGDISVRKAGTATREKDRERPPDDGVLYPESASRPR